MNNDFRVDEADQNEQDERTWGVVTPSAYVVVTESRDDKSLRTTTLTGYADRNQLAGALAAVRLWRLQRDVRRDTDSYEPKATDLLGMFAQINRDCEQTGEQVVPLTNVDYYAEQIQNIYELSQDRSTALAEEMSALAAWVDP